MADTKFSELPAAASALDASELPVIETGTPKKVTVAQVKADVARVVANVYFTNHHGVDINPVVLYASAPAGLYRFSVHVDNLGGAGNLWDIRLSYGRLGSPDASLGQGFHGLLTNIVIQPLTPGVNTTDVSTDSATQVYYHDGNGDISFTVTPLLTVVDPGDTFRMVLEKFPDATLITPPNPWGD